LVYPFPRPLMWEPLALGLPFPSGIQMRHIVLGLVHVGASSTWSALSLWYPNASHCFGPRGNGYLDLNSIRPIKSYAG
jgi:hypothetical protein